MGALSLKLDDKELAASPSLNSGLSSHPLPLSQLQLPPHTLHRHPCAALLHLPPSNPPTPRRHPCAALKCFSPNREAWRETEQSLHSQAFFPISLSRFFKETANMAVPPSRHSRGEPRRQDRTFPFLGFHFSPRSSKYPSPVQ